MPATAPMVIAVPASEFYSAWFTLPWAPTALYATADGECEIVIGSGLIADEVEAARFTIPPFYVLKFSLPVLAAPRVAVRVRSTQPVSSPISVTIAPA